MSPQYGELQPTSGWDRLTSLGYPCKFQLVSRVGSVTAQHLVVGVSQTLRRRTEGATYIRQGDHQVGHWPTFLVVTKLLSPSLLVGFCFVRCLFVSSINFKSYWWIFTKFWGLGRLWTRGELVKFWNINLHIVDISGQITWRFSGGLDNKVTWWV